MDTNSPDLLFAWAAGLFEGEGNIYCRDNGTGYLHRRLECTSTDRDVIEKVHRAFGGGKIYGPYMNKTTNRKPWWKWRVQKWEDLEPIARRLRPFLCERRREALDHLLANPPLRRKNGDKGRFEFEER